MVHNITVTTEELFSLFDVSRGEDALVILTKVVSNIGTARMIQFGGQEMKCRSKEGCVGRCITVCVGGFGIVETVGVIDAPYSFGISVLGACMFRGDVRCQHAITQCRV